MNIDMVYMYSIMCMYIPYSIYIQCSCIYFSSWSLAHDIFINLSLFLYFFFVCLLYIENNAKLDGTLQTVCITKSLWIFRSFCAWESKSVKHGFFFMQINFFFCTPLNQSSFIGAWVYSERRHWIFSQPWDWMFNSKHFDVLFLGDLLLIDDKIHNRSALELQP